MADEKLKHRRWEITAAILFYSLCSSTMLIVNKLAVTRAPMASLVTSFQLWFCVAVVLLLKSQECIEVEELEWKKVKPYLVYVISFILGLYTNMKALSAANVETVIVFRAACPLAVAFLEHLFLGRMFPNLRGFASLGLIGAGAFGYVATDKQFMLSGFGAYTWVSLYFVVMCFTMTYGKHIMNAVPLKSMWSSVFYTNILGLPMTIILGVCMGELDMLRGFEFTANACISILISSCIGVAICYAGFKCRSLVSATTYTLVGVLNKVITILINCLMWDQHATTVGISYLSLCLLGGLLYKQSPMTIKAVTPPPIEPSSEEGECAKKQQDKNSDTWISRLRKLQSNNVIESKPTPHTV